MKQRCPNKCKHLMKANTMCRKFKQSLSYLCTKEGWLKVELCFMCEQCLKEGME